MIATAFHLPTEVDIFLVAVKRGVTAADSGRVVLLAGVVS
jgi:hypothetical protein